MKKKLNILCLLICIVVAADVIFTAGVAVNASIKAYQSAASDNQPAAAQDNGVLTLSLIPTDVNHKSAFKAKDEVSGKTIEAWPIAMIVPGNFNHGWLYYLITGLGGVAVVVGGICSVVAFVRFIINVNRGEVFTTKTVKLLRTIGRMFLLACLGNMMISLCDTGAAMSNFRLEGYMINYAEVVPFSEIVYAVFTLIIAEAFAIGLKMKEEQELTI